MKKYLAAAATGIFFASLFCTFGYAEESGVNWAETLKTDKVAIKTQKQEMKANAQAAKTEEKKIKGQIRQAKVSGDVATAQQLKGQLKTVRAENVQQRQQDKKELKTVRRDAKQDLKAARHAVPSKGNKKS